MATLITATFILTRILQNNMRCHLEVSWLFSTCRSLMRISYDSGDIFINFFHVNNCSLHETPVGWLLPWWTVPVALSTHEIILIYITTLLMFHRYLLRCMKEEYPYFRQKLCICVCYEWKSCMWAASGTTIFSNLDQRKGCFLHHAGLIYGLLSGLKANPSRLNNKVVN